MPVDEVMRLFQRSGLQPDVLEQVLDLATNGRRHPLSFPEFIAAMHLTSSSRGGHPLPHPTLGLSPQLRDFLIGYRENPGDLAMQGNSRSASNSRSPSPVRTGGADPFSSRPPPPSSTQDFRDSPTSFGGGGGGDAGGSGRDFGSQSGFGGGGGQDAFGSNSFGGGSGGGGFGGPGSVDGRGSPDAFGGAADWGSSGGGCQPPSSKSDVNLPVGSSSWGGGKSDPSQFDSSSRRSRRGSNGGFQDSGSFGGQDSPPNGGHDTPHWGKSSASGRPAAQGQEDRGYESSTERRRRRSRELSREQPPRWDSPKGSTRVPRSRMGLPVEALDGQGSLHGAEKLASQDGSGRHDAAYMRRLQEIMGERPLAARAPPPQLVPRKPPPTTTEEPRGRAAVPTGPFATTGSYATNGSFAPGSCSTLKRVQPAFLPSGPKVEIPPGRPGTAPNLRSFTTVSAEADMRSRLQHLSSNYSEIQRLSAAGLPLPYASGYADAAATRTAYAPYMSR